MTDNSANTPNQSSDNSKDSVTPHSGDQVQGDTIKGDITVRDINGTGHHIGHLIQNIQNLYHITWLSWIKQQPLPRRLLFSAISITLCIAVAYWFLSDLHLLPEQPTPMPSGEWNTVVAGIGTLDDDDTVRESEQGHSLSNRIYAVLKEDLRNIRGWDDAGVWTITGTKEERYAQALTIAERMNASIVVYGVIEPTRPGWATFTPEFYVADTGIFPGFSQGVEIIGPEQFGSSIEYPVDVVSSRRMQDNLAPRFAALQHFVRGLQSYAVEDFTYARQDFCLALGLELVGEGETAHCPDISLPSDCLTGETAATHKAVIHLFLGALEHTEKNYSEAMHHAALAHCIWPEYPRPFLTRAAILYSLALEQHQHEQTHSNPETHPTHTVDAHTTCAELDTVPSLTTDQYLDLALRCYDEAFTAEALLTTDLTSSMDMQPKMALSRGGIYFLRADRGEAQYWNQAQATFEQVVNSYCAALDGSPGENQSAESLCAPTHAQQPDQQRTQSRLRRDDRLRRLAAHAHARLGAIIICKPDCENPARKEPEQYQQAVDHYEKALALLQRTKACKENSDKCSLSDVPYIKTYQCQLAAIYRFLGRPIPHGWECNEVNV